VLSAPTIARRSGERRVVRAAHERFDSGTMAHEMDRTRDPAGARDGSAGSSHENGD
jgi:hypothetical protein